MSGIQQHEYQQYSVRCRRSCRQDFRRLLDRRQIRRYQPGGCDRRLLPLPTAFQLRHARWRHALRRQRALAMRRYVERDLWCYRLEVCTEVGCLHRPHALAIQWRIVEQLFREQQRRYYGGIALQVLKSRRREDRRRCRPRESGPITPRLWNIGRSLCAEDSGERRDRALEACDWYRVG